MWKLEFWKLEIKLGNWKFEELFKDGILEIGILENYWKMEIFKNWIWKLEFWKIIWERYFGKLSKKLKSWKIILRMEFKNK